MRARSIKGLHKVPVRLANGWTKVYWYAWRGGPRLAGEPGSPEFKAAYDAAIRAQRQSPTDGTLAGLAAAYRASPEFAGLAESTQAEWSRVLDRIRDKRAPLAIGALPVQVLSDPRVKTHLFAWRDQWKATPRKADYALQVLSAALTWADGHGMILSNVLLGHSTLYKSNRASVIWTVDEVARFKAAAPSPEVGFIVRLACLTGLRRADLLRLEWSHVGDVAITIQPEKSSRRRQPKKVTIPLLDETLTLLDEIRRQQAKRWQELIDLAKRKGRLAPPRPVAVLTSTRGRRWSKDGAEHQVVDTKHTARIDKHLHDCRGTFATRLRLVGATNSEIADVLGWTEDRVERLLAIYVDTDAVVRAFAERLRAKSAAHREP